MQMRVAISTARNPVSEAFGLTDTQFGWVLSAFALGYALFQTPAGALADRYVDDACHLAVLSSNDL